MISAPYPTGDPKGTLYTATVKNLSSGLYQYKFYVTFQNGKNRWCIDPCTKYGGTENNNSAFIIGEPEIEMKLFTRPIQTDLVVYELMIDDFAHHIKTPNENYFGAIRKKNPTPGFRA
jgi:1,4-alpha-glucan branching enzyme